VSNTQNIGALAQNNTATVTATCPTGTVLLGGGGNVVPNATNNDVARTQMKASFPSANNVWTVRVQASGGAVAAGGTMTAYAICAQ
jgi:hypothetical protein